jgi:hypothetical protein
MARLGAVAVWLDVSHIWRLLCFNSHSKVHFLRLKSSLVQVKKKWTRKSRCFGTPKNEFERRALATDTFASRLS